MQRILMSVIVLALAVPPALAAETNVNIVRWLKGTMVYRTVADGKETGSEEWLVTVHPDGTRTLTTTNRVDTANTQRTVVLRVAENFRPLDLYSSFWFEGAWIGTSLITIEGDTLNAVASTPDGRITQRVTIPEKFAFIPHPLQSNAWQVWTYDKAEGGQQTSTVYDLMTRLRGPGNLLGPMYNSVTTWIGRSEVTVPAGTFDTDHFRTESGVDMYIAGPDLVLVKFVWHEVGQEYVLTSLETGQ